MGILDDISNGLQKGDADKVQLNIKIALDEGIEPRNILDEGLLKGMEIIGEKFKNNEVFVPEVLMSARAMNFGMDVLKPMLVKTGVKPKGKVVIGTVKGDLHDIGKNLVKMMMESAGFELYDLGSDVSVEQFIKAVQDINPDILGMSALLTTTMINMKEVIDALKSLELRDKVFVMVGGAPVTEKFANDIGADSYANDAAEAVSIAKKIVSNII